MFDEDFYDYTIKTAEGKRVAYDVDSDIRSISKFLGFDVQELFWKMKENNENELTLTITLRRYPEND